MTTSKETDAKSWVTKWNPYVVRFKGHLQSSMLLWGLKWLVIGEN